MVAFLKFKVKKDQHFAIRRRLLFFFQLRKWNFWETRRDPSCSMWENENSSIHSAVSVIRSRRRYITWKGRNSFKNPRHAITKNGYSKLIQVVFYFPSCERESKSYRWKQEGAEFIRKIQSSKSGFNNSNIFMYYLTDRITGNLIFFLCFLFYLTGFISYPIKDNYQLFLRSVHFIIVFRILVTSLNFMRSSFSCSLSLFIRCFSC